MPFRSLSRSDVEGIAAGLIRSVFERDGLLSRRCVLRVEPMAMEQIVDAGFHPQLGVPVHSSAHRRQLTTPVASTLATIAPGTPTIIDVYAAASQLAVRTQALEQIKTARPALPELSDAEEGLKCVLDAVDRIDADQVSESTRILTQGQLRAEHFRRLAISDQAGRSPCGRTCLRSSRRGQILPTGVFSRATRRKPRRYSRYHRLSDPRRC